MSDPYETKGIERRKPLKIAPPDRIPIHIGEGAEETTTLEGLVDHSSMGAGLAINRTKLESVANEAPKPRMKVDSPPRPRPVQSVAKQATQARETIDEPSEHEEEIIIEQRRDGARKPKKEAGGVLSDPNALAKLVVPDFSAIPDDPHVYIPRKLRPDPRRLAEISKVLLKHGAFIPLERLRGKSHREATARRFRKAFEELGPTFIKLGQMMASSPGIFPREVSDEFLKCLDKVPPFPFKEVKRVLHEELGTEWEEKFRFIDAKPVAAASIAQVHFAELADGTPVVIKVQRPGIRKIVERDLGILFLVAKGLVRMFDNAHLANPVGIVSDFNQTLHEELDFRLEVNSMERFNAVFASQGEKRIYSAEPHRELCTKRVIVMERLAGARVDDLEAIRKLGVDPEDALRLAVKAVLRTMMLNGFFHGDVHAGNILITKNAGARFLDFGIVGRLEDDKSKLVTHLIVSLMAGTFDNLADVLIKLGSTNEKTNRKQLQGDLKRLLGQFKSTSLGGLNFGDLLTAVVEAAVVNHVRLPREFVLLVKQMVYFDRYAHILAPDLDIFDDRFLIDFLWRDPLGRKRFPQMQMIGMLGNVRSLQDLRSNRRGRFDELPERYRGKYRYWDGTPLEPNELQCVVCNIIVIAKRPFEVGDRVFCQPCGTRMVVIEKDGNLTAEPIYSPDAQEAFRVTEGLQEFTQI